MLRIVYKRVLTGLLLSASALLFCAEVAAQANAKATYSNRPIGYSVPSPYYGTPMAPRFMAPPVAPMRFPAAHASTSELSVASPVMAPIVAESSVPQQQVVKETVVVLRDPPPEVSVNDELDAFYARLAKILLEKHQLPEALALVQQIKSETFKVRTVVNLAEFVSRDKNYRSEAEQLYRLALTGMESLDKKRPFRIDSGNVKIEPAEPKEQPVLIQPAKEQTRRSATTVQVIDDEPSDSQTAVGNGTGKLPPPPPPKEDPADTTVTPAPAVIKQDDVLTPLTPTPPIEATPIPDKVSPPDSIDPKSPAVAPPIVKPDYGISLEGEEEPKPVVVVPKTPEKPQTPAPAARPRPRAVIVQDEN